MEENKQTLCNKTPFKSVGVLNLIGVMYRTGSVALMGVLKVVTMTSTKRRHISTVTLMLTLELKNKRATPKKVMF